MGMPGIHAKNDGGDRDDHGQRHDWLAHAKEMQDHQEGKAWPISHEQAMKARLQGMKPGFSRQNKHSLAKPA